MRLMGLMGVSGSTPSTLSKATKAKEGFESGEDEVGSTGVKMSSQKEITLRDELELSDRTDIYRNYLLYCMSGDVVSMPMGGAVVLERDNTEFGRLSQLGDILGLTPVDVMKVHTDLAEQAFRQHVKAFLDEGPLTKDKTEALTEMQSKMGLSAEQGQKIIKGVQNERMASSLQSAKAMGDLSIEKLLDMKDTGVEIEAFTSLEFRRRLYEQEAERIMSDGKGDFDEHYLFTRLPTSLVIDATKVTSLTLLATLEGSPVGTGVSRGGSQGQKEASGGPGNVRSENEKGRGRRCRREQPPRLRQNLGRG